MILLIDGYNLIYTYDQWAEMMDRGNIDEARARMVSCLSRYLGAGKREIIVVFDGRRTSPRRAGRTDSGPGNIRIFFSGQGLKADEEIIKKVQESENPSGITVVTSDRFIKDRVKRLGAAVIESRDFRHELFERLKQAGRSSGSVDAYPYISYDEYMRMLKNHEKTSKD